MSPIWRIVGIGFAFFITSTAWLVLGGVTSLRSSQSRSDLSGDVAELWGRPQTQAAPSLSFSWFVEKDVVNTETVDGAVRTFTQRVQSTETKTVSPSSTDVTADLKLDRRLRGLVWYALYDVGFEGSYTYVHRERERGTLTIQLPFPDAQAVYDGFHFVVDGEDRARELKPSAGNVATSITVNPGQTVTFRVGYESRGMDSWQYSPSSGVGSLEDFQLLMTTDFRDIDFPPSTMSPSTREETADGYRLSWTFAQALTGRSIGMVMPNHIQPGELASSMAFSAPISLFFFFLLIFVLATIKDIDIHPINYLLIGAAFLCFHLLFAYSVDHISVVYAFIAASVVSVGLVVSYLRLVVSARFAFVEAGLAQMIYLVGFSLAHFWDGLTGLTVTVLSILTVFLLMQLTGRIRWSEVLARRALTPAPSAG